LLRPSASFAVVGKWSFDVCLRSSLVLSVVWSCQSKSHDDFFVLLFYIVLLSTAASVLGMATYDLDFGKKNSYVPASAGDGGQGTFGAVSPNNWRVPGTSPIGQRSYPGAPDGGDEPWFAEAISTVSLDLKKAEDTLMAFTKEAADLKVTAFCASMKLKDNAAVMKTLVSAMGYNAFLEASPKQLEAAYKKAMGIVDPPAPAKSE
jgi:hypothetical protein